MYDGTPKKLWHAAAASVYAHLLALYEEGRIDVVGELPLRRTSKVKRT
jgi:hypothetical protein